MSVVNLKVVIVGDSGVGKSTLAYAMSSEDGVCAKNIGTTVGAGYVRATMRNPLGGVIGFDIWDTAGQERYRSLVPMYLRGANVILYVVDGTESSLVSVIDFWQPYVKAMVGQGISPLGLVVRNKCDTKHASTDMALSEFATRMQYDILRTSATTGIGTRDVLKTIVRKIYGMVDGGWERNTTPPPSLVVRLAPPESNDTEPPPARRCQC